MVPFAPLQMQVRRVTRSVVGRASELAALCQMVEHEGLDRSPAIAVTQLAQIEREFDRVRAELNTHIARSVQETTA